MNYLKIILGTLTMLIISYNIINNVKNFTDSDKQEINK